MHRCAAPSVELAGATSNSVCSIMSFSSSGEQTRCHQNEAQFLSSTHSLRRTFSTNKVILENSMLLADKTPRKVVTPLLAYEPGVSTKSKPLLQYRKIYR